MAVTERCGTLTEAAPGKREGQRCWLGLHGTRQDGQAVSAGLRPPQQAAQQCWLQDACTIEELSTTNGSVPHHPDAARSGRRPPGSTPAAPRAARPHRTPATPATAEAQAATARRPPGGDTQQTAALQGSAKLRNRLGPQRWPKCGPRRRRLHRHCSHYPGRYRQRHLGLRWVPPPCPLRGPPRPALPELPHGRPAAEAEQSCGQGACAAF